MLRVLRRNVDSVYVLVVSLDLGLVILIIHLLLILHLRLFRSFRFLVKQKIIKIICLWRLLLLMSLLLFDVLELVIYFFQVRIFQIYHILICYVLSQQVIHKEHAIFIRIFLQDHITNVIMILGNNKHFFNVVLFIFE